MEQTTTTTTPPPSFRQRVHNFERELIAQALQDADGHVTQAARALGFQHHQSLIAILNTRHKDLMAARTPIRPRRKHLIDHGKWDRAAE